MPGPTPFVQTLATTNPAAVLWLRGATLAGLTAGLASTVATSAALNLWARFFEPKKRACC